jgi:hypothetical protein
VTEPAQRLQRFLRRSRALLARSIGAKVAAGCAVALFALLCFVGLFVASTPTPADQGVGGACAVDGDHAGIPADYFPWLPEAAAKYKLGPRGASIVAAIHYVESDWD